MSREDVIRRIVEREMQGQPLTEEAVRDDAPALYRAACEVFGTWGTALHYAGVRCCRRGFEPSTPEEVIQQIRRYLQMGRSPMGVFVRRRHYRLHRDALRYFGTWRRALAAAGVDLRRAGLYKTKRRPQTDEEIIEALRAWHAAGHSMAWRAICLENRQLAVAAHGRFEGWRRALLAAGIPVTTAAHGAVAYGIRHGFWSGSGVDTSKAGGWTRTWWPIRRANCSKRRENISAVGARRWRLRGWIRGKHVASGVGGRMGRGAAVKPRRGRHIDADRSSSLDGVLVAAIRTCHSAGPEPEATVERQGEPFEHHSVAAGGRSRRNLCYTSKAAIVTPTIAAPMTVFATVPRSRPQKAALPTFHASSKPRPFHRSPSTAPMKAPAPPAAPRREGVQRRESAPRRRGRQCHQPTSPQGPIRPLVGSRRPWPRPTRRPETRGPHRLLPEGLMRRRPPSQRRPATPRVPPDVGGHRNDNQPVARQAQQGKCPAYQQDHDQEESPKETHFQTQFLFRRGCQEDMGRNPLAFCTCDFRILQESCSVGSPICPTVILVQRYTAIMARPQARHPPAPVYRGRLARVADLYVETDPSTSPGHPDCDSIAAMQSGKSMWV